MLSPESHKSCRVTQTTKNESKDEKSNLKNKLMGKEEGSGWGTHVYLWRIHFDTWQNQYNTVKLKNKIKLN